MTVNRHRAASVRTTRIPPRLHPLAACLACALLLPGAMSVSATPRGGSIVVQNCDDSGAGSLRDAITTATSGATIDLGGLSCGTITLTGGALTIAPAIADLAIQGPGAAALTISGNDSGRVFEQQGIGTLSLSGLTLTHGFVSGDGGCVLAAGNLALSAVTVTACAAGQAEIANVGGGGVAVGGNATLGDSTFSDNTVDGNLRVRGGAIVVAGTLTATNTAFTNNQAWSHTVTAGNPLENIAEGGAILALGTTHLTDSTISGNTARSDSYEVFGGGVAVGSHPDDAEASLDVLHSVISGNQVVSTCDVCAPQGGGIAVVGLARLRQTTLDNNSVTSTNHYGGGGGMRAFNAVSLEIQTSTISGNHADSAGGGILGPEQGTLSIDGTHIVGNFAGNQGGTNEGGGGVLCFGCTVQLSSSTVSGNVAESVGGGIAVRYGEYAPSPAAIIDSTISGNSASEGGGMMLDGGNASFSNSTIAFNLAGTRGAGISASEYSYQLELQSTIVSNNLTNGAANNVWAFPDTVSGANNLVPNAAGLPAEMPGDTLTADPLLLPLANNGGRTPTHAFAAGSVAHDAGNNAIGLVFDQRGDGYMREVGTPDIGAFEQQSLEDGDVIFRDGFEAP